MVELFGDMPHDLLQVGKYSNRWFTTEGAQLFILRSKPLIRPINSITVGNMRMNATYHPISLESVLERQMEKSDVVGTAVFLKTLLNLRPDNRASPHDIINHQWFSE